MEYMLILAADAEANATMSIPGQPGFEEQIGRWVAFNRQLIADGSFIAGGRLQDVVTATTVVTAADGSVTITDGPFAETKELFGGYYVIRADDLDAALEIARRVPLGRGSVEVRPMLARTGEDGSIVPSA
jgi:hypothetical protein